MPNIIIEASRKYTTIEELDAAGVLSNKIEEVKHDVSAKLDRLLELMGDVPLTPNQNTTHQGARAFALHHP